MGIGAAVRIVPFGCVLDWVVFVEDGVGSPLLLLLPLLLLSSLVFLLLVSSSSSSLSSSSRSSLRPNSPGMDVRELSSSCPVSSSSSLSSSSLLSLSLLFWLCGCVLLFLVGMLSLEVSED